MIQEYRATHMVKDYTSGLSQVSSLLENKTINKVRVSVEQPGTRCRASLK